MALVEYFKAAKTTHRYNANQKVWITLNCANHLYVWFKWRGKGRYVEGIQDKFAPCVGEIKTIKVSDSFAERITEFRDDRKYRALLKPLGGGSQGNEHGTATANIGGSDSLQNI